MSNDQLAQEVITCGFIAGLFYDHKRHRCVEIYEYNQKFYVVSTGIVIPFDSLEKASEFGESLAEEP
jgi:hypothetical protein